MDREALVDKGALDRIQVSWAPAFALSSTMGMINSPCPKRLQVHIYNWVGGRAVNIGL